VGKGRGAGGPLWAVMGKGGVQEALSGP